MKDEQVELNESTEMNEELDDTRLEMSDEQVDLELLKDSDEEILEENTEMKGMPEDISNFFIIFKRCGWLIALLILQSCSSWILSFFDDVCKKINFFKKSEKTFHCSNRIFQFILKISF
jgi:hypothetical protein